VGGAGAHEENRFRNISQIFKKKTEKCTDDNIIQDSTLHRVIENLPQSLEKSKTNKMLKIFKFKCILH